MVEYRETELDGIFAALADPTRREVLEQLRSGPATVSDLAEPFDISIQGVSKHLKKLEEAGLIRRTKEGREVWCELVMQPMLQASSWIDEQRTVWEARLDRLEKLLDGQNPESETERPNIPDPNIPDPNVPDREDKDDDQHD